MIPARVVKPYDYAKLYDEYYTFIFKFCYRNTDRNVADAEDLTHDVFILAFKGLQDVEVIENFWSWIFVIAKYRVFRFWKYAENKAAISIDELMKADHWFLQSNETSPETKIALAEAWGAMGTPQKRALFLTKICGFTSQEVGDSISAADSTVRTQLGQAAQTIRNHVPRHDLWQTAQ